MTQKKKKIEKVEQNGKPTKLTICQIESYPQYTKIVPAVNAKVEMIVNDSLSGYTR